MSANRPRRHHYIPRFLLREFAADDRRKRTYVWRRSGEGRLIGIADVAVARDFHGDDRENGLETAMSQKYESRHAPLLQQLVAGEIESVDPHDIAEFLAHIMVRTAHLRDGFSRFGQLALDTVGDLANSRDFELGLRRRACVEADAQMREMGLNPDWQFGSQRLGDIAQSLMKTMPLNGILERLPEFLAGVDVPTAAQDGHLKAMSKKDHLDRWVDELRSFTFDVVSGDEDKRLLGDFGVLGYRSRDDEFGLPIKLKPDLDAVLLPLGPRTLLVGRKKGTQPPLCAARIRLATAKLSRDFFVFSKRTQVEDDLAACIGTESELLSSDDARRLAEVVIGESERANENQT